MVMVVYKTIQDKYYNLDQTQNTLMLICISNKIHVDTFYLLHIIKIHRKHKNEKKVNKKMWISVDILVISKYI